MKTIITLILFITGIIWAFDFNISFKPFKISSSSPYFGIGLILFSIGLFLMFYQVRTKAKDDGVKQVIELLEKQSHEKTN